MYMQLLYTCCDDSGLNILRCGTDANTNANTKTTVRQMSAMPVTVPVSLPLPAPAQVRLSLPLLLPQPALHSLIAQSKTAYRDTFFCSMRPPHSIPRPHAARAPPARAAVLMSCMCAAAKRGGQSSCRAGQCAFARQCRGAPEPSSPSG